MKMRLLLLMMVVIFAMTACENEDREETVESTPEETTETIHIDWIDFIKFNDIMYTSVEPDTYERDIELGAEYSEVEFKLSDVVIDPSYLSRNGDAAFHEIGTKVYEVVGYRPEFRLAVKVSSKTRLYESDYIPNAKDGRDVLDIDNKVEYITLNSDVDGKSVLYTIDNEEEVNEIVKMILESSIIMGTEYMSDKRFFIEFHLNDNTSVRRAYFYEDGVIHRSIVVPEALTMKVQDIINSEE